MVINTNNLVEIGNYLLERFKEPSSHTVILVALGHLGQNIDEGQLQNFLYLAATCVGFLGFLTKEGKQVSSEQA